MNSIHAFTFTVTLSVHHYDPVVVNQKNRVAGSVTSN